MSSLVKIQVATGKPVHGGFSFYWSVILELTREQPLFQYADVFGKCDPSFAPSLQDYLRKLVKHAFIAVDSERKLFAPRTYCVLKRQSEAPAFSRRGGEISKARLPRQYMWNVLRRERQGITSAELAVAASTDEVSIAAATAEGYCRLLAQNGLLLVSGGTCSAGSSTFVLKGSANTGPKAPRAYSSKFLYDPNTGQVTGDALAAEDLDEEART